jgi:hypothetical protein
MFDREAIPYEAAFLSSIAGRAEASGRSFPIFSSARMRPLPDIAPDDTGCGALSHLLPKLALSAPN